MNKSIEVIDNSKKLEESIKRIWTRNVFFMWWYALFFAATVVRASFNRLCQIPRLVHNMRYENDIQPYVRKVSKYKWLDDWNSWVDSNYWKIWTMFLFFFSMALSKTVYHIGKIIYFLWVHVLKPLLWMLVVLSAAKTISQGLAGKRAV